MWLLSAKLYLQHRQWLGLATRHIVGCPLIEAVCFDQLKYFILSYILLSSYFLKNLIENPPCKRKWESIFLSDTFQPQGHACCLPVSGLLWRFKFDSVSSVDKKLVNSHLRKRWKILVVNHNPGGRHSESSEKLPKNVRGGQYILDLDKGECAIKHTSFFFFFNWRNCFTLLCWFLPYINVNQP